MTKKRASRKAFKDMGPAGVGSHLGDGPSPWKVLPPRSGDWEWEDLRPSLSNQETQSTANAKRCNPQETHMQLMGELGPFHQDCDFNGLGRVLSCGILKNLSKDDIGSLLLTYRTAAYTLLT